MKKTLIHTDEQTAYKVKRGWDIQKQELQKVIDLYNITGFPKLTTGDLQPLFSNTNVFLFDKLTGGSGAQLVIGAAENKNYLPIDKEAAINIMQKPAGYNELLEGIKKIFPFAHRGIGDASTQVAKYSPTNITYVFVIDEAGELQYSERTLNEIEEAGKYYIQSETGNKLFQFVTDTVAAYYANGLDMAYNIHRKPIHEILMDIVKSLDPDNKTFVVNSAFAHADGELLNMEKCYEKG